MRETKKKQNKNPRPKENLPRRNDRGMRGPGRQLQWEATRVARAREEECTDIKGSAEHLGRWSLEQPGKVHANRTRQAGSCLHYS